MVDVEEKLEYKVERKSWAGRHIYDAADKLKASEKAMGKKMTDPDRDLEIGYMIEKVKEELDQSFVCVCINYYKRILLKNHCWTSSEIC